MTKKITRSMKNKMIAGVCAGFAEYFNVDPLIVRLLFMALCPFYGGGLIAYLVCALLIPEGQEETAGKEEPDRRERQDGERHDRERQGGNGREEL